VSYNPGDYDERIEIQERGIVSHASGHAQVWASKGKYNGQLTEKISALMSLQQQSSTPSRWLVRFPDDPRPTYRYSRFVLDDGRVFLPVRDPKRWGRHSIGVEVECEEQTNVDGVQIQSTIVPSISEPPSSTETTHNEYFTGDGVVQAFALLFVPSNVPIVVIDGLIDGTAVYAAGYVTTTYIPTSGAVIEVVYESN